jgi:MFS transporter, DHA1 family, inner membrane transport protein
VLTINAPPCDVETGEPKCYTFGTNSQGQRQRLQPGRQQIRMEEQDTSARPASPAAVLGLLWLAGVLEFSNTAMISPLLVDIAADFGSSVPITGQLTTVLTVAWGTGAFLYSSLTDRFGRKPFFMYGLTGLGIFTAAAGFAPTLPIMMAVRFLSGLAGGAYGPTIVTIAADRTRARHRGRAIGILMTGVAVASLAGVPAMTWLAANLGWRTASWATGFLMVLISLAPAKLLRNTGVRQEGGARYFSRFAWALRGSTAGWLLAANGLQALGYLALNTYLGAFFITTYGLALDKMAIIMAIIAIGPLVGSYLGGYVSDRWRRVALCSGAAGLGGILAFPLVLWTNLLPLSLSLATLFGGAHMATRAPLFSMVTATSQTDGGTMMGLASLSSQVG